MKNMLIKQHIANYINVDIKEINKFDIFGADWWNTSSVFKALHHINPTRLHYIIKKSHGLFNKKVLDVGCGGGILSESMAEAGAKVTGLDISTASLESAKSHALTNGLLINYIQETIEEHAKYNADCYDVITCMEVLEHVPYPFSIVCACSALIKKGGSVFFSTPNRTLKAWLLLIIGAEYTLRILPQGTHDFNKFITPNELLNWIDCTTLEEHDITSIQYNPIIQRCTLTPDTDVNYILHTKSKK